MCFFFSFIFLGVECFFFCRISPSENFEANGGLIQDYVSINQPQPEKFREGLVGIHDLVRPFPYSETHAVFVVIFLFGTFWQVDFKAPQKESPS